MDCRDFRRRYSAYRDGHDPELAADMDDHLEVCARCAAFDRAVREGTEILRGGEIAPSPAFLAGLEARIQSGEVVPEPIPPRVSPWAATAAVLLLAILAAMNFRDFTVLSEPVAAEVQPMVVAQPRVIPAMPFIIYERTRP